MAGVREAGLSRDVGWEIGVSKTLPYQVEEVWQVVSGDPAVWLGEGTRLPDRAGASWTAGDGTRGEVRSRRDHDRIRLTWRPPAWTHDSTVQVAMRATPTGTTVRFHQERLASSAERSAQRTHWQSVMAALEAALARSREEGA
ncbi:SRPBCC domain-containing protein [Rhodococcus spelaei]|uniref:SRPBCC domain-containing protein n=1 Tax=Rhodococcus spelaei TaxID=2546320 RepID=A0A541B8W5_9NOCA|nr:SRPBCC domain-containing protein [Rhodococcus spelaei]TQF68756.1 SRPBCC domain-containing protein [Rhodococcus spelaei]